MKVTYKQILTAKPELEELSRKELKIKEAVALARLIKNLNSELEIFTQKNRELCEKYGKADEKTGEYKIKPENQNAFATDFEELLSVEIETESDKIKINSLESIEAALILSVEPFVEFED